MRRLVLALPVCLAAAVPGVLHAAARLPTDVVEQAEREGSARVILRLAGPRLEGRETHGERAQRRATLRAVADAVLARLGAPPRNLRRFHALPLLALDASPAELAALAEADEVLAIEPDRPLQPSLTESIPRIGANVSTDAGWDGTGSVVVIADTGVESSHPFLGGRVVAEACFSDAGDCPNGQDTQLGPGAAAPCTYGTLCWHGTHMAGIVAGSNATMHGVAPGAWLIPIQVGSRLDAGCGSVPSPCVVIYDSSALAALEYVADTLAADWNIAAVNMSFGTSATWSSDSSCDAANSAYKDAFDTLRAVEIAPVAASGNGSVTTGISAPACVSSGFGVGASFDTGDVVWNGSNSGPPLDLLAPGTNINSSVPVALGSYASRSGTSMATPHVAGAFAVLRQADPAASVADLALALESTGLPITDSRNGLVRPRIQVDDAVRSRAPAACFDGLDNDGDGRIDVDGDGGQPDPGCVDGFGTTESSPPPGGSCGLGPELAPVALLLLARRRRNRDRA